jgi:hypothetical protein
VKVRAELHRTSIVARHLLHRTFGTMISQHVASAQS